MQKWLSNLTSKLKKATSSKVMDVSMVPSSSSRPLSPTSGEHAPQRLRDPAAQRQGQRQLSLPWGDQGNPTTSPARMKVEVASPGPTAANSNCIFPPSFEASSEHKGHLITENLPVSKQEHIITGHTNLFHSPVIYQSRAAGPYIHSKSEKFLNLGNLFLELSLHAWQKVWPILVWLVRINYFEVWSLFTHQFYNNSEEYCAVFYRRMCWTPWPDNKKHVWPCTKVPFVLILSI